MHKGKTDIIIVEDDFLVGEISRDILASAGYSVKLISSPLEALTAINKTPPRLVITDIMMPGITGLDLCKLVKADPALAEVKVMVVSAKSFEIEKHRAHMFGAIHFLTKPFTEKGLLKAVKDALGQPAAQPH